MELLNKVAEFFVGNEYRLLIIDSIMALFRVDYTGRGELNERQQKLNQFLSKLTHVAEGVLGSLRITRMPLTRTRVQRCCTPDQSSSERPRSECPLRWCGRPQACWWSYPRTRFSHSYPITQGSRRGACRKDPRLPRYVILRRPS